MNKDFEKHLKNIEASLSKALPLETNCQWQQDSFRQVEEAVNNSHLTHLLTPCRSLMDLGGKRWRPLLLVLCSEMARESGCKNGLSLEQTYSITPLVEFVHTASLIHDDIEDCADTRRGKPSAYITYGLDTALNAGAWLYFEASTCIDTLEISDDFKFRLYKLYSQELRRLHLGQAMDINWHRNPELIPSIEEYAAMVHCKTGTLASLAAQIGVTAGGADSQKALEAGRIAAFLGEGFQILDDVQNLTTGNPGKKRGDDIVEGKKSLPVLLHLKENPEDAEKIASLFEQARKEGINSPAVEECIALLESKDAIKKARQRGLACINENSRALSNLFGTAETTPSGRLIIDLFSGMANA